MNITDFSGYKPDYEYSATWMPTAAIGYGLAGSLKTCAFGKDIASILIISTSSQASFKIRSKIKHDWRDEHTIINIDQNNRDWQTIPFILLTINAGIKAVEPVNTVENGLKSFKENNVFDTQEKGIQEI